MKIHIVKKGDTLYSLSKKYGVSLDQLIAMNPQLVDPNQLSVGMKVKVPSSNYPAGDYEIIHKHIVKEGDTLWKLSKAWGVPLNVMIAANPQLKNPNILLIGQVINIAKVGSEKIEEDAGSNNKHDQVIPKSKAEMMQSKEEMLVPKEEMMQSSKTEILQPEEVEVQQEILQEQSVKQEEKVALDKEESTISLEAVEKEKMNLLPLAEKEAVPIPLSQQGNEPHPIAPYAVYPSKEQVSAYSAPLLKPYTASMPAVPVLPGIIANTSESDTALSPPYSMDNLVPCDPSQWSSGCGVNSYSGIAWGNPLGAGCVQGIYLGNCPPGTIPMSNWDGMATQAYTMYSKYEANQAPVIPSSNYSGMSVQPGYEIPTQNENFTGYSHMPETNANVIYGQYSQPAATSYSNAINSWNIDHQQASKARIESVESIKDSLAAEQKTSLSDETTQVGDKSGSIKKSYKTVKKKTKASSAAKTRQKRRSMPWINE